MPLQLTTLLKELKEYCKDYLDFNDNRFVFGFYEPFAKTTIEARKNRYCKQAGVIQIRIHDFRHSHVSMLLQITSPNRIPFPVIAKRLGHTIEVMLNTYAHMLPNDQIIATKGIEEKLEKIII